jgi:ABC-2 type transport system ATP-binding protein
MTETVLPILIENLAVTYGDHLVLDGLSLSVPAGSVTALLGGNGAGKSTTLSTLLGFVKAQDGAVSVCGIDPCIAPDAARRLIAYLPENVALYEHLSAVENAHYLLAFPDGGRIVRRSPTPSPPPDCRACLEPAAQRLQGACARR